MGRQRKSVVRLRREDQGAQAHVLPLESRAALHTKLQLHRTRVLRVVRRGVPQVAEYRQFLR